MLFSIQLPDSFEPLIKARSEAELSTLIQTALLYPSLQESLKLLQADSLLALHLLSNIQVSSMPAPLLPEEPEVDFSLALEAAEDEEEDDDNCDFKALIDFLGG